jgi:uncharacterized protein YqiB (DUF1249 family)
MAVAVMEAAVMVMAVAISMAEAISTVSTVEATTAFALRISVAGATWAADPHLPVRLRSEAREASAAR